MKKIGEISLNVLSSVISMINEPGIKAIEKTVITAAPIIIKGVKDLFNTDMKINNDVKNIIETKRSVGMLNDTLGYETDVISYEILNYVNSICNAINKIMDELGEENVFIDELLIGYFILNYTYNY